MARQIRRDLFDRLGISIVHCVQRAVRRAMLCGYDKVSKRSYEQRREWIRSCVEYLAGAFGIDILGYAIMGNHLHVILRNRPDVVETWSDDKVAKRWWKLFPKRKDKDGNALETLDSNWLHWTHDRFVAGPVEKVRVVSWSKFKPTCPTTWTHNLAPGKSHTCQSRW